MTLKELNNLVKIKMLLLKTTNENHKTRRRAREN